MPENEAQALSKQERSRWRITFVQLNQYTNFQIRELIRNTLATAKK
ncbi:17308_t:CDS:2, partial [Racocetra fulgida]